MANPAAKQNQGARRHGALLLLYQAAAPRGLVGRQIQVFYAFSVGVLEVQVHGPSSLKPIKCWLLELNWLHVLGWPSQMGVRSKAWFA